MLPPRCIQATAARGAGDHADLDQIGLDHFLDRVARFGQARGERLHADRTAAIDVGDHRQVTPVHRVEAERVDLKPGERGIGGAGVHHCLPRHIGKVPHPAQQPPGDARGATRTPRNLRRTILGNAKVEQRGGAGDDAGQFLDRVELQPHGDAEAIAQRRRQQPLPRRRTDQSEARQIDAHTARRRPLPDHQVERAVLHRGIEHLLDCRGEAVNLVDEQDVAILEIGEQRGEIARLGDHRAGRGAETDTHFLGDDLRQRGLAQPRRAEEQHMIERIPALAGSVDEHAQVIARRTLADEFVERLGAQRRVDVLRAAGGGEDAVRVGHLPRPIP